MIAHNSTQVNTGRFRCVFQKSKNYVLCGRWTDILHLDQESTHIQTFNQTFSKTLSCLDWKFKWNPWGNIKEKPSVVVSVFDCCVFMFCFDFVFSSGRMDLACILIAQTCDKKQCFPKAALDKRFCCLFSQQEALIDSWKRVDTASKT